VKTEEGLHPHWLTVPSSIVDHRLNRAHSLNTTLRAGLLLAFMSPEKVVLDHFSSAFFEVDMGLGLEYSSQSYFNLTRPLFRSQSLMLITDLKMTDIHPEAFAATEVSNHHKIARAIKGFHAFLAAMRSLRSLSICFRWELGHGLPWKGYSQYAPMLLNGMLERQKWWNLQYLTIEGVTSSSEYIIKFINDQPNLVDISNMDLRVKDEWEALKLVRCLRQKNLRWFLTHIVLELENKQALTGGELQSLVKENEEETGCRQILLH